MVKGKTPGTNAMTSSNVVCSSIKSNTDGFGAELNKLASGQAELKKGYTELKSHVDGLSTSMDDKVAEAVNKTMKELPATLSNASTDLPPAITGPQAVAETAFHGDQGLL